MRDRHDRLPRVVVLVVAVQVEDLALGDGDASLRAEPARLGRPRLELPQEAGSPSSTFRVVFSPRNTNITAWVSGDIGSLSKALG